MVALYLCVVQRAGRSARTISYQEARQGSIAADAEGNLDEAAQLFERITTDDQYVEFLTLPAYQLID